MTLYLHTHTDTCARLSFMGKYGCGSREKNALSGFFKTRKNIIVYAICLRRTRKKKNERRAYATNEKFFFFSYKLIQQYLQCECKIMWAHAVYFVPKEDVIHRNAGNERRRLLSFVCYCFSETVWFYIF